MVDVIEAPQRGKKKILFFLTEDWFFCSHFIDRALAAKEAGYEILVMTNVGNDAHRIQTAGFLLIPIKLNRRSINPLDALLTLIQILSVYSREKPDLIHHVALKPILLGSLAARILGIKQIINAIVGMGYIFTSKKLFFRLLRPLFHWLLGSLINPRGSRVVFENADDMAAFVARSQVRSKDAILIRGAGVDLTAFNVTRPESKQIVVALVARMLWDKGVGEFVEAAQLLRQQGYEARFVLIGDSDPCNRASIGEEQLCKWRDEGIVEWWGFRADIPHVLAQAHIACLPSYREGLPKSLLEAMAAGLPCVTTDVPGCREAVRHGDNGLLVPPRDPVSLANAIQQLLNDTALRERLGARGRERVELEFSKGHVIEQTLILYRQMLPQ